MELQIKHPKCLTPIGTAQFHWRPSGAVVWWWGIGRKQKGRMTNSFFKMPVIYKRLKWEKV